MSQMAAHSDEHYKHPVKGPEPHVMPVSLYWGVFILLLCLTVITVWVAEYDFGAASTAVALLVASTKAGLVMAIFMHLWFDNKFYTLVISSSLVFLSLFVLFPMLDEGSRAMVDPIKANFLPRDEAVYKHELDKPNDLPLRPGLKEANKDDLVFEAAHGHE
jgi:cytochrome c oxidase subunit 4